MSATSILDSVIPCLKWCKQCVQIFMLISVIIQFELLSKLETRNPIDNYR